MNVPEVPHGETPPNGAAHAIEAAVLGVLEAEGVLNGEMSVTLLDDTAMADLHARYLGVDAPTDVLSFDLKSATDGPDSDRPLGDVYVGYETGAAQAAELGVDVVEELVRLAVHGVLHVLGYDHPTDGARETSAMYLRQEELVRRFFVEPEGA